MSERPANYFAAAAGFAARKARVKPTTRSPSEHAIQTALVARCRLAERKYPALRLLVAIPNGAALPARWDDRRGCWYKPQADKLKREGLRAGVWDLLLAWPAGGCHGLWLETKSASGRLSAAQQEWRELVTAAGYAAVVYRTPDEGWAAVMDYLGGAE